MPCPRPLGFSASLCLLCRCKQSHYMSCRVFPAARPRLLLSQSTRTKTYAYGEGKVLRGTQRCAAVCVGAASTSRTTFYTVSIAGPHWPPRPPAVASGSVAMAVNAATAERCGASAGRRARWSAAGTWRHSLAAVVAGGGRTRAVCSRRSRSARTQHWRHDCALFGDCRGRVDGNTSP